MSKSKDGIELVLIITLAALLAICFLSAYLLFQVLFNETASFVSTLKTPVRLELIDKKIFQICKEVSDKEPFKYYEVEFYVYNGKGMNDLEVAGSQRVNFIYIHPSALELDEYYIRPLIAHGISHIYHNSNDQIISDYTAAAVLGSKKPMRDLLLGLGLAPDHPRVIALQ